jgi:hypothetical protein
VKFLWCTAAPAGRNTRWTAANGHRCPKKCKERIKKKETRNDKLASGRRGGKHPSASCLQRSAAHAFPPNARYLPNLCQHSCSVSDQQLSAISFQLFCISGLFTPSKWVRLCCWTAPSQGYPLGLRLGLRVPRLFRRTLALALGRWVRLCVNCTGRTARREALRVVFGASKACGETACSAAAPSHSRL